MNGDPDTGGKMNGNPDTGGKMNGDPDIGGKMRTAYGQHTANALAYGVPINGYTIKDKIGYPNTCTPIILSDGTMKKC